MNRVHIRVACLLLSVLHGSTALAQSKLDEFDDFSELSLESLLEQEVVSASKYSQRITDTPVSAVVITAEEIRAAGAVSIPELLRYVPGMDVIGTSASTYDVSARGRNTLGSNSLLVMIDGRSVYEGSYNTTLWEFLPISMGEIRAIEVILGPGSALYGANAFAGVVNVITEDPGDEPSTQVRATGSDQDTLDGSLIHSGRTGRLSYRVSGAARSYEDWELGAPQGHMSRFNGDFRWSDGAGTRLGVSGGLSNGLVRQLPGGVPIDLDGNVSYVRTDYGRGDLRLRGFINVTELLYVPATTSSLAPVTTLTSVDRDLEMQHTLRPFSAHRMSWGGSYRHRRITWSHPGVSEFDLYAGFLYDEWEAAENWIVSTGMRFDYHPLVGGRVSPRGGLVYKPRPDHAVRFSFGSAYRNPTHMENYLRAEIDAGGLPIAVHGVEDLEPSLLRAYDLGYQALLSKQLFAGISVFHNRLHDLITLETTEYYTVPPAPLPGMPAMLSFVNRGSSEATGGEIFFDYRPADGIRLRSSYAYLWQYNSTGSQQVWIGDVPKHKANLELRIRPRHSWTATLWTRYRSRIEAVEGLSRFALDPVGSYVVFDGRLAWRPTPSGPELAVTAYDLLDKRYREHPQAIENRLRIHVGLTTGF